MRMTNEEKKMGESIPTAGFGSEGSVEEKGPGNWFRKENASPPISGTSFADNSRSILDIYSSL